MMPMRVGGKLRLAKAPKLRKWEDEAAKALAGAEPIPTDKGYRISLAIWWPDRRKRDIDGPVKVVFDALVRAGILIDDSLVRYFEVETPVSDHSLDDIEPGVDIRIITVEDWEVPF
tara:strand:- start:18 stop:365 length:348 start_codon:yes stop_codon:yes gene_type:complete